MRTWRLLFAVGLLAALVVPASGASAKPHETGTTPHTECTVNGQVKLSGHADNGTGGLDRNRSDGHYEFSQAALDCESLPMQQGKTDTFAVTASGDTTDIWHGNTEKDGLGSGESCEQGGSAKSDEDGDGEPDADGDLHSGEITATGEFWTLEGEVHFARLGSLVLADGPLEVTVSSVKPTGTHHFFQAELEFTPTEGSCADKQNGVTAASLTGTAQIYRVNDPGYFHDCSLEEEPKPANDPHCTGPPLS